jgi:hypothetical protein
VLPDGNYYLPGTDEVIPADMATPSPDDRFHHCFYYPMANEFDPWGGPTSMGRQTQDEMLLCSNELYVVGHSPHSNLANNLFASSCDSRGPTICFGTCHFAWIRGTNLWRRRTNLSWDSPNEPRTGVEGNDFLDWPEA